MQLRIKRLNLTNFKGQTLTILFDGDHYEIIGDNATGKTIIADAFHYLFCDRDSLGRTQYEIKNLTPAGEPVHGLEHSVEADLLVDGIPQNVKKTYAEKWTKRKGASRRLFEGHVITHYVDGIARRKKDYLDTLQRLIPEHLLPVFISPTGFNSIPFQDRRRLLTEIAGNVTDGEILTRHPEFALVPEILAGRTEEETRSVLKGTLRAVNKDLEKLPVRMDEVNRTLPDGLLPVDTADSLKANLKELEAEDTSTRQSLEQLLENEARRSLQQSLAAARDALGLEEVREAEVRRSGLAGFTAELQKAERSHQQVQFEIDRRERRLREISDESPKLQAEKRQLHSQWETTAAATFQHTETCTCSLCGQHIPEPLRRATREKARARFLEDQQQTLQRISRQGQETTRRLDALDREKAALEEELSPLREQAADTDQSRALYRGLRDSSIASLSQTLTSPVLDDLRREVEKCEDALQQRKEEDAVQESTLRRRLADLAARMDKTRGLLAHTTAAENARRRTAELEEEQRTLTEEYEKLESQLALLDAFTRTRMELLQDRINHHFAMATFRLFDTQVNGEIVECCDTLYEGVPYNTNLNHGHRIAVGIDIINTLSRHYNISMPLFVDNRESVSELPPTNAQVISLVVARGERVLRCQPDPTIKSLPHRASIPGGGPGF